MDTGSFEIRLAQCEADLVASQRLRYRVFVQELGGGGAGVDHASGIEQTRSIRSMTTFC